MLLFFNFKVFFSTGLTFFFLNVKTFGTTDNTYLERQISKYVTAKKDVILAGFKEFFAMFMKLNKLVRKTYGELNKS